MLGKTAANGALMIAARLLTRVADLITMVILARVLNPANFGLVAIAMSVVLIVEAALDLPVNNVLLRGADFSKARYDTAFTLSLMRGILVGLFLVAISLPFAAFYNERRLAPLICALCISPIFRGLTSPVLVSYQKQLSFWRDFTIEALGKIAASAIAIAIALSTHSYWAIATATILNPVFAMSASYLLAPYRPALGLTYWGEFKQFLGWNSAAQVLSAVNWQVERLVLGRLQSPAQLGLFSTGNDFASIPYLGVFVPLLRPIFAAFTHVKNDRRALQKAYERTSEAILAIGLPLLVGESLVAEPAVRLALGDKWVHAAPLVHWLALSFIPTAYAMAATPLFMALGKTQLMFRRNLLEFTCKMPSVLLGVLALGFIGVIMARVASEMLADFFCLVTVRRLIGLSLTRQIFAGWRSMMSAGAMASVISSLNDVIVGRLHWVSPGLQLALLVPCGACSYILFHVMLWWLVRCPDGIEAAVLARIQRIRGRGMDSGHATSPGEH